MDQKEKPMDLGKNVEFAENTPGIKLDDIKTGEKFMISTQNTEYVLEKRDDGLYLSGNEKYCPTPRKVSITGSSWGGSAIKSRFIGEGMRMEFSVIEGASDIITSSIGSIEKIEE